MGSSIECQGKKVEDLVSVLKPLCESYRLLVGAAEEFNSITLAHKRDLKEAIDRADDLGKVIDHMIKTLDCLSKDWLHELKNHPCPDGLSPLSPNGDGIIFEPEEAVEVET